MTASAGKCILYGIAMVHCSAQQPLSQLVRLLLLELVCVDEYR